MSDPRAALAHAIGQKMDEEWWDQFLDNATKKKTRRIRRTCPGCKRANDYDVEMEMLDPKVVEMLLNQAHGRPMETKKITVDVRASTAEEMRELSSEQLLELASG